ncbi:uncharacterized protein ARB_03724 [Trichophyton benhamiae CBS 112371]|uniref:non-specific serine/threonine protein kinase n=1 Tax=Arthroderma benhamiae (strain ATCC MYA-4681 / CBS 112371) TaxID=663331 RepID=D4B5I4_ARTBC|nr:uncharacterized protein ARB_03724 [Trichophyton benhamiae CBS 112371]EFE29428.1 hypothetical protein ARB_03724 [Trichophyton benhamiae CBS 112371]
MESSLESDNAHYIPKSDIEVLSQEIDNELGMYRIRTGNKIRYLTIEVDAFDEDTMCRPYLLIPELPSFPNAPWTKMDICRSNDGSLKVTTSDVKLQGRKFEVLSLKRTRYYRHNVHEVIFNGAPAIAKIVRWEWELPRMENETAVYSFIYQDQCAHPEDPPIAPQVLAHLTEDGRVMGLLLEKVNGRFPGPDDLARCEEVVRRVHDIGIVHGDINRYNFLIDDETGNIRLVDFEHAKHLTEETARAELDSLPSELAEETGRGTTTEEKIAIFED